MDALLAIVLVLLGASLLLVEILLIPGINVVGVLGLLALAAGVVYAYSSEGWTWGTVVLLLAAALVGLLFWMLHRSGAWERFVNRAELRSQEGFRSAVSEDPERWVGREGTALTPLRPSGIVEIDGRRWDVVTEGEFIARSSRVRVVRVESGRLVVRLAD
ncbi:MAG: hypothetical protein N2561_06150 [Bacteroidetes bacterium]|nr:hypothetical protein [Rhodothermia bacterium]MCX7907101.1 hypothetical protein [Bacteroidota bacterium]MDW8285511.1 NfeD family protein [Bacteroidota bacterium]